MGVIIFDFDDTLYSGDVWGEWQNYCYEFFKYQFKNLTEKELNIFLNKNNYDFVDGISGKEIAAILKKEFGTSKSFIEYQNSHIFEIPYENAMVVDKYLLKTLSKEHHLYIVSNSTKENVLLFSKKMGIDVSIFTEIFSNDFSYKEESKYPIYKYILYKEKIDGSQVLVVGNSYNSDLLPAEKLNMKTMLVKDANFTMNDINKAIKKDFKL